MVKCKASKICSNHSVYDISVGTSFHECVRDGSRPKVARLDTVSRRRSSAAEPLDDVTL